MFSYFSVNCVFNIIEYFSYLNLWLVILFLFIMLFFFVLGSTQLISSSRLCSDVVFETSLVVFSLFLVIIIISPALIILLDLELIIMPSFIIYSCGVQWLWSFSLSYFNWINNCDHYVYSSYLIVSKLSVLNVLSVMSVIYLTHNTLSLTRLTLNTLYTQHVKQCAKFNYWAKCVKFSKLHNTLSLVWVYWINQSILNKTQYVKLAVLLFEFMLNFNEWHFIQTRLVHFIMYWAKLIECVELCVKRVVLCCVKLWVCWALSVERANQSVECVEWSIERAKCVDQSVKRSWAKCKKHVKFNEFYLSNTNELIILPLLSTIRYYVFSYDVIHSLGIYSFGIKIDAIPGRFNFTTTIQTLIKGEHRGMCYELCGLGHSSMLIIGLVLSVLSLVKS